MKRFYFIFLPVIVYPEYFVCRGGDSFLFIFLKTKKNKKKHPRSESNPGFQSARALLAAIHSRARYLDGIEAMACMWALNK